jgi:hypothetical protein
MTQSSACRRITGASLSLVGCSAVLQNTYQHKFGSVGSTQRKSLGVLSSNY